MDASPAMQQYFDHIEEEVKIAYNIAKEARQKKHDPEQKVDIPLAKGIGERVEGLVSAIVPEILNSGVAKRIISLEKEYGLLDWRVALKIAEEVAQEKFCHFETKQKALETGIRVGLAYITLGVISAPLEGFIELKIKKRKDGKDYLSAFYAGPIRAAGGTAEAVSLVIADYVRIKTGYPAYDPTEQEINRTITEVRDYHERAANLQYFPSDEEISFLLKNLPIEINGDPTEEIEVSNYKDIDRIETNRIRGGVCLVLAEGLAQKAAKVNKQLKKWGKSFGLGWDFLSDFLEIQKKVKAKGEIKKDRITPNYTYIKDLVAGRPVLSFPMRYGGLRLRYGRTRVTGLAAAAIHPQTMNVLNNYIAIGTQLKVERPGKAAAIVACDSIDGPIVKFKDGSVAQLDTTSQKPNTDQIERILFLGDILFNYGDFSESGHRLVPSGYCQEWWIKELEKASVGLFGSIDFSKISELVGIQEDQIRELFRFPIKTRVSARAAISLSREFNIPLHPTYTYFWSNLSKEECWQFYDWILTAKVDIDGGKVIKLILKDEKKELIEKIGLPHLYINKEFIVIESEHAHAIYEIFLKEASVTSKIESLFLKSENTLHFISAISNMAIRDKAGTFIGARMGRPEKAKMRKLVGAPHFLFPVGEEGGRLRSIQSAQEAGKITAEFPIFICSKCKKESIFTICEICEGTTEKGYYCDKCGIILKRCNHDYVKSHRKKELNINELLETVVGKAKIGILPDLIKGVRGTSNKDHVPEHMLKGILRAKNNICVNKDGTTRYDMIELPITHFKPKEINTPIEKLIGMGYTIDIKGRPLADINQVVELKPQDVILPSSIDLTEEPADECLFRVANFVDDLLESLYGQKRYYKLKSKKDLIGHLIIGLAPHTSAGTIGRIVGFSKTQGMFTHPLFHAAMRRNCDGDEACAILLMDALLNFSRSFLPDKRGSRTMDAPLVLTSLLVPGEVDDEVHGLDVVWQYPLEFYSAATEYKNPWDIKIAQIDNFLNTPKQYEGMGYTHEISNINDGVLCSSYKTLPTMEEKLKGQMDLAEKIAAVTPEEVAQLVIEKHFLKDIKGNLRKFSTQQFRCVSCNEKYRRPPLVGKCLKCDGKIIFTISEGSIIKYLEPTLSMSRKYNLSPYLKQVLESLNRQVESVLGKEKEKQEGLGKWFG